MFYLKFLVLFIFIFNTFNACAGWQPFELKNNQMIINIKIDGHEASAILDSGANINLISREFANKHGENFRVMDAIRVEGANSSHMAQVYNNVPVDLFGSNFDLDGVVSTNIYDAELILGSPFFDRIVLQIDFPNSRLQILSKKTVNLQDVANVPMRSERGTGLPVLKIKINGKNVWLTLNTGSNGAVFLKRSIAESEGWLNDVESQKQSSMQGLAKVIKTDIITVNSLKLGPYELENIEVHVPASGEKSNIGKRRKQLHTSNNSRISRGVQSKGVIGIDILKHFIVTVDFSALKLHVYAP